MIRSLILLALTLAGCGKVQTYETGYGVIQIREHEVCTWFAENGNPDGPSGPWVQCTAKRAPAKIPELLEPAQ